MHKALTHIHHESLDYQQQQLLQQQNRHGTNQMSCPIFLPFLRLSLSLSHTQGEVIMNLSYISLTLQLLPLFESLIKPTCIDEHILTQTEGQALTPRRRSLSYYYWK